VPSVDPPSTSTTSEGRQSWVKRLSSRPETVPASLKKVEIKAVFFKISISSGIFFIFVVLNFPVFNGVFTAEKN
jgi:hypothetical protein